MSELKTIYQSLPGIANNQPEVYETQDLPESEQNIISNDFSSEAVDCINIDVRNAFKKFNASVLNTANVNFSDNISERQFNTGYSLKDSNEIHDEDEMLPVAETPLTKYNRISAEIDDLVKLLAQNVQPNPLVESKDETISNEQLKELVEALKSQLQNLEFEKYLGPDAVRMMGNGVEGHLARHMYEYINGYESSKKKSHGIQSTKSDVIEYDLVQSSDATSEDEELLHSMSKRLELLEKVLASHDKVTNAGATPILPLVRQLTARSALLEPAHLDSIESHINTVLPNIQTQEKPKLKHLDAETQGKIAALYELVKKWDHATNILSNIGERLNCLSTIHSKVMGLSRGVGLMDSEQQQLMNSLAVHSNLLSNLKETTSLTVQRLEENRKSLDCRIDKLL